MTPDSSVPPTIHATALLVGRQGVLICGPSGAGKSMLAWRLIHPRGPRDAGDAFACLIGDDRVHVEARHGRLVARPAPALAGRIELRGLGIRPCPYEPAGVIGLIVDLAAPDCTRLPDPSALQTSLEGVTLPRLPVAEGADAESLVRAALLAPPGTSGI